MSHIELNWSNLRTWKNDRRFAFEELCCQLAAKLDIPNAMWTRNGTPDGGVEGFWTLKTILLNTPPQISSKLYVFRFPKNSIWNCLACYLAVY